MARKLWSGNFPLIASDRQCFESKAAAYEVNSRWVCRNNARHEVPG